MATYNTYIELSPHYESVVDIDSEERNPNLWQEYIIHEDMKVAIDKICESLRNEYKDARRSFWIHGAYGTGKSYAAIVLKHLFEEPVHVIRSFMTNKLLEPYRNKFAAVREKGDFLVVWKSGCTGIRSGSQLMMEMEMSIRKQLEKKFGDHAYYGKTSLIAAVKDRLQDPAINWLNIYKDQQYSLSEDYASFEDFYQEVMSNNLEACNTAASIISDKGWGLFDNIDMFQEWIKDVIEGNHLKETGIIFIWDEFTKYIRDHGDENVLQKLAEYCKQQPFFMFLIVHIEPGWVASLGEETYKRILHRYHELEFHISEGAAYELIGNSILTRPGMYEQWDDIKDQLMLSIKNNISDFDMLELSNQQDRLRQLCPIHPMTLSLLATVAHNFGASQRTLFRFMKDRIDAQQQVGFIHYINTYGPDDWKWLTPDFLWDYFFTRESDVKGEFSTEARRNFQHYFNKKDLVAGDINALHVFKAVMLLIAVMSTQKISQLRSQMASQKINANKFTLYRCFAGQLSQAQIDQYLEQFENIGIIRLDKQANGDARLELPYTGNVEAFDIRLNQIKSKYTRYELFKKGSDLSKALESRIWDSTEATYNRLHIVACSGENSSLSNRSTELITEINKAPYKIGLLIVAIAEPSQFIALQQRLSDMAKADDTKRIIFCILKEPFTDEKLNRWHETITHKELAGEEGKKGSADQYQTEAELMVGEWAQTAVDSQFAVFYQDTQYPSVYGKDEVARCIKNDVIYKVFSAGPELLVTQSTAFKKAQESAITAAIKREQNNKQVGNIASGLQAVDAWNAKSLDELARCSKTAGAKAIAALAKHISQKLSQGAKVKLDELWQELQSSPFGYYDSLASAYLLGYVMRFYINGEFNWVDNTNNTFPLDEKNLASMIYKMCRGEVDNHTLSSGSAIWRQFKPYVQKIFKLSDAEAVNEDQARKYTRDRIISTGAPLWAIKYIPEDELGTDKDTVCRIVDKFCDFVTAEGNQEEVMTEVITLFKGRGQVRQFITDVLTKKDMCYEGFWQFVIKHQPELHDLVSKIGINSAERLDNIKSMMQEAIYTWTEEQVIEKLGELVLDYKLIAHLNTALGVKKKTIFALVKDIANRFNNMKIPGSVLETLDKEWIPTLKVFHTISLDLWGVQHVDVKKQNIDLLSRFAKETWEYITSSKLLLGDYLQGLNIHCSAEEVSEIYSSLPPLPYDTPVISFKQSIDRHIVNIDYERNKQKLLSLWKERSGQETVANWCNLHLIPIQWVIDDTSMKHVSIIKSLNDGDSVDASKLSDAVQFFEKNVFSVLSDVVVIKNKFVNAIGENNANDFFKYKDEIIPSLKTNLGNDIFSWGHKAGEVRNIIEKKIREKKAATLKKNAQKNVKTMAEGDLRNLVIKLLDNHPELCDLFIDLEK